MKILKEKVYHAKSDRNSTIFYNWAIAHDLVPVQKKNYKIQKVLSIDSKVAKQ